MSETDVLVLGAGPAGCAAAIRARQFGLRVMVLESNSTGSGTPGETMHPGLEALFRELGVLDSLAPFHRHEGVLVQWDREPELQLYGSDTTGPWRGWQVPREALNTILRKQAVRVGAEILSATPVHAERRPAGHTLVEATERPIHCRYLFDATGRRRWLAEHAGTLIHTHGPRLVATFGWDRACHDTGFPELTTTADGWRWRAPLGSEGVAFVRLSVGSQLDTERCQGASREVTWRCAEPTADANWYLLGDAACELDPLSSHGILRATMSGMLAAHLSARVHRRELPPEAAATEYHRWIRQGFDADVVKLRELYLRHPSAKVAEAFRSTPAIPSEAGVS